MVRLGILAVACLVAGFWGLIGSARADVESIIVIGHVTLPDGSPPPFTVSIQRECSDQYGDAPGPLTDKKGQWVWRMDVDLDRTRSCYFLAHHDGYSSSRIDASNLNLSHLDKTIRVPDIVISSETGDPYALRMNPDEMSGKAQKEWNKAMKALDDKKRDEAFADLQELVTIAPKSASAWQSLAVVNDKFGNHDVARDAYKRAIELDPKEIQPYVTLTRLCIKMKDWECGADTAASGIKEDHKHGYPELYLHEAVARFELKDLAGAEESVDECIRLDKGHKMPRAEYVLGRILEAKGDLDGAREHMMTYLSMDATATDAKQVQAHMLALGKPEAAKVSPDLEIL